MSDDFSRYGLKGTTFFVVEDHALTNLGIRQFLENEAGLICKGFASTKTEAFDKLVELSIMGTNGLPEILVLDLFLGEESGIDILREIKIHFPSIKTVVYSMYSNPGIVTLLLDVGAEGFVSKAGTEKELVKAIGAVKRGESYIQPTLFASLKTFQNILDSLTKNERFILNKIIERKSVEQIAVSLDVSESAVSSLLTRILSKTGCKTQEDLIAQFG